MTKTPTRSPTHEDIELGRLASMGLEVEEIASVTAQERGDGGSVTRGGETVALAALVELAEDRGRPVSHYLAAIPLATELRLAGDAPLTIKVCAGTCQRWGALDLLEHLAERLAAGAQFTLAPVSCLDRCDQAPACEVHGPHGQLVVAPATPASLDEAVDALQ